MNLKKKKKGFTLIELMAVIAIIAILAAVLVPTVNGYINRAKKTAIITQARNVVNAVETYNATAKQPIVATATTGVTSGSELVNPTLKDIQEKVGTDMLDDKSIDKLYETAKTEVKFYILSEINKDSDAVKNIELKNNGKLRELKVGDQTISLTGDAPSGGTSSGGTSSGGTSSGGTSSDGGE